MEGIHKVYPDGTVALRGVDLEVRRGEILGLLGENGAGKTTLMKILSGFIRPTKGRILVEGRVVKFRSPRDALSYGIAMVHQTFTLVPGLTALENIILGRETSSGRLVTLAPLRVEEASRRVEELCGRLGLKVPLDTPVELLPLGFRQRVEILKALYRGTRLLILDEPTTFLTPLEVEELFKFMRRFRDEGGSSVFITHKIKEVLKIADRIVVLRKGLVVDEVETEKASPELLATMMVGREINLDVVLRGRGRVEGVEPVLRVENLWVQNDLGLPAVRGVSFDVYPGEIFGVAGVEGNGQDELVEAIAGLRRPSSGRVLVDGVEVVGGSALEAYRAGLSHIPGDRERYGLVLDFTVVENSLVGRQWEREFTGAVGIRWSSLRRFTEEVVRKFNVVVSSLSAPVRTLSGGNRQRLLVGRELSRRSKLVVAVHPTKGLDIASTMYVRELLARARDEGRAVLLISADLEEVLQLSDRIAVMYEGRFLAVGRTEDFTLEDIGLLMGGIEPKKLRARAAS